MRERQEEIATSITLEHGKPLKQARLEVIRGAEFFEWDAGEAMRTYGRIIPAARGHNKTQSSCSEVISETRLI